MSPASATSAISVPSRMATDSGFSWIDRIDGISDTSSPSGYWRQRSGGESTPGGHDRYGQGQEQSQPQFTPLVARRAAAFPASLAYSEAYVPGAFFGSDLLRAVSIYEFNMRLFAGNDAGQGSVINRYS